MSKVRKGDLVDQAYAALKKKILTVQIKPGECLDEKVLMEELGIGRTPLRQAILLLKNESFIGGQPNKSSYVREFSLEEVKEIFETLMIIEKNINHLAARRITDPELEEIRKVQNDIDHAIQERDFWEITARNFEFHHLIARASRNRFLGRTHRDIRMQAERLSYISVSREFQNNMSIDKHNKNISKQHHKLMEYLKKHDSKGIEVASVEHVDSFRGRILNHLMEISYV